MNAAPSDTKCSTPMLATVGSFHEPVAESQPPGVRWFRPEGREPVGRAYQCEVVLEPAEDGQFAVYAAKLPGAASQGATEAEALGNIEEALCGLLKLYLEEGEIPWTAIDFDVPPNAKRRWIVVNVDA